MGVIVGSSIYNAPSIYESGAGGGSVIYKNYETDFSEFNVTDKYDIPKEGYLTSYSRLQTYEKENGKLKIIGAPGNTSIDFFNPVFFIKKNSILNLFDVEFEAISGYSFLWLDMYSSSALLVHTPLSANKLIFLVDANLSYTSTMPILYEDSTYKWLESPFNFSQDNDIHVEYDENETRYYLNNTLLITTYHSFINNVNGIIINPRENQYIKISGIKFKQ